MERKNGLSYAEKYNRFTLLEPITGEDEPIINERESYWKRITAPAPIPIRIQGHGLPMGMNLHIEWFLYGVVILGIVAVYLVISGVLTGKIKRIVPAEVLKNRE